MVVDDDDDNSSSCSDDDHNDEYSDDDKDSKAYNDRRNYSCDSKWSLCDKDKCRGAMRKDYFHVGVKVKEVLCRTRMSPSNNI